MRKPEVQYPQPVLNNKGPAPSADSAGPSHLGRRLSDANPLALTMVDKAAECRLVVALSLLKQSCIEGLQQPAPGTLHVEVRRPNILGLPIQEAVYLLTPAVPLASAIAVLS